MKKEMSNEEFINSFTIDYREFYEIHKELEKRDIKNIKDRLEFVEENYSGQYYMYFALEEVDDIFLSNKLSEGFILKKTSVDYLLRAFGFAIKLMPEGIPEHVYEYMKDKSNIFFDNLIDQCKQQGIK